MRVWKQGELEIHPEHLPPMVPHSSGEGRLLRYMRYTRRHYPAAKNLQLSLQSAFAKAAEAVPSIEIHRGILGGTPSIKGTRIPVYMILDAFEYWGSTRGVARSYPRLGIEQIRDAIRFAKLVTEGAFEHEVAPAS